MKFENKKWERYREEDEIGDESLLILIFCESIHIQPPPYSHTQKNRKMEWIKKK